MKPLPSISALSACLSLFLAPFTSATPPPFPEEELQNAAQEAYTYAYPLVLMEITRRVTTNVAEPESGTNRAPVNQFAHARTFPTYENTDVVRLNADTLYSLLWYDVSKEPLIISIPDSEGRFYLLPMLSMWTDTFAVPGKRASGTHAQTYAITNPHWQGELPEGATRITAPTPHGWILGRTQTNGEADYAAVHRFQKGIIARPLSAWDQADWKAPKGTVDPKLDMASPVEQVEKMSPEAFYTLFTELLRIHPPQPNDQTVLMRLARLGITTAPSFSYAALPDTTRAALEAAPGQVRQLYNTRAAGLSRYINNWSIMAQPIGTYGTDFFKRAFVAYFGLGALPMDDAFYPTSMLDSEAKPLYDSKKYTLRFTKEQLPKVRAFWSLTMYNERQFFAENPINRYAIGDRNDLKFAEDGSLTLYIQRESPGKEKESNWLPAPASGSFSVTMRLYWPDPSMTSGMWQIPAIQEQK